MATPSLGAVNHPPAGLGEEDHHFVDLVLLASGAFAGTTDQHFLRLAARKAADVRRDQA
jgi:hypothetical protein